MFIVYIAWGFERDTTANNLVFLWNFHVNNNFHDFLQWKQASY